MVSILLTSTAFAEEIPQSLRSEISTLQKEWGNNQILVKAVQAQNSQATALDKIKSIDKKWMETAGLDDFMKTLLTNEAAKTLAALEKRHPYVMESFIMDNQGALVGMTNKTSDYWQGDEAKFTESYKGGNGSTHIGEIEFDKSAQAYLAQVSVPVVTNNTTIGVITIGINTDDLP